MEVKYTQKPDASISVHVDNKKIGFIAITSIQLEPSNDHIIKDCTDPKEDLHMWHFFDTRSDKSYIRTGLNGFIIEENSDFGLSWFKQKVSRLVVKPVSK